MKLCMSRPLVALALLVGLMTTAQSQSFLTNGLVAYYPFNGNANDASGNNNNGIVHFATLTSDRFGRTNQAYNFIANNSCYISFANTPLSQTDNWTMAAWVNPASTNLQAMAVTVGYDNNSSGNGFEFGTTSQDGTGAGNDLGGFLSGITALGSGYAYETTNVWYHIVMLRRSGVTYFYANGSQTPNTNTNTPKTPTGFYIGSSDSNHRFFNGAIDDVRIYNRALSSNEVAQLYAIESITNLVVSPANPLIAASSNQQFTATGYFQDGSSHPLTTNLTWTSSASSVATIDTNGLAIGVTNGSTLITAISGNVSNSTTLTVVTPPAISTQPTNNTVSPNGSVILNVAATGGVLSYQWQLNGTNIAGATGATLNIPGVTFTNIGVYTVVVSNLAGNTTSQAAIVSTTAIQMFAGVIVDGPLGSNYLIQATSVLPGGWTTLTNVALPSQPYIYIDYSSPTNARQFYRALPQ